MKFTKETLKRMLRTFLQTAIGYIVVNFALIDITGEREVIRTAVIGLFVSAISSGLAAVMNLENTSIGGE